MASPIPCSMCNESPDADFLITSRNTDFMLSDNIVNAVCVDCLIKLGLAMYDNQGGATPEPEPEPDPEVEAYIAANDLPYPERAREVLTDNPKRRSKAPAAGEGE